MIERDSEAVEDPDWRPEMGSFEPNLDILEPIRSIMEDEKEKLEGNMGRETITDDKMTPEEKEMVSEDIAQSNHK